VLPAALADPAAVVSNYLMRLTARENYKFRRQLLTSAIFLSTAGSLVYVLIKASDDYRSFWLRDYLAVTVATIVGPLALIFAAVRLFYKRRSGYAVGLFAGLVTLPVLVWREFHSFYFQFFNPWIGLNLPDRQNAEFISFSKWRILCGAITVVAVATAVLRMLPEKWTMRGTPLSGRTWPAFLISLLITAAWFASAASPYRIPIIVDGSEPDLAILHVTKCGPQFNETAISLGRNGRYFVSRNRRRWFSYQWTTTVNEGVLPPTIMMSENALPDLAQFKVSATSGAQPLHEWNAEGWYVRLKRSRILEFRSDRGTLPPDELVGFFHEVEKVSETEVSRETIKDVCFGFCYDPRAALGLVYVNQRCFTAANNITHCE
jgi:hypothetical protein